MSVTAKPVFDLKVTETLDVEGAGAPSISWNEFSNPVVSLNGSSTPPISQIGGDTLAMSGGAATIDLTALPTTTGTVDLTGVKVVLMRLQNPSTNTGSITVATGASNGYVLGTFLVPVGGEVQFYFADGLADVGASTKTIDVSGTGTEVLNYVLVAG